MGKTQLRVGAIIFLIVDWILPFAPLGSILFAIAMFHQSTAERLYGILEGAHK